jgi:hypothetical protein
MIDGEDFTEKIKDEAASFILLLNIDVVTQQNSMTLYKQTYKP